MKIGIDVRLWNETGVGRYIRNLVKNLHEIDKVNDYILFARATDVESIKYYVSSIKWKIVVVNIRWHSFKEQLKFPQILYRENLDLMHFPYFSVPFNYRKPFIVTIHDLIIYHYSTGKASTLPLPFYQLKRLGYKFAIKQAIHNAKKVIVPLQSVKEDVIETLQADPKKIIVTQESVDEEINNANRQMINPQLKSENYFLYVGNAYPHKNIQTLLQAFESFKKQIVHHNVKLFLVGKKDYFYSQLENNLKEKQGNAVHIFHTIDDSMLHELYDNAIALIAPSFIEGFGLVPLEAMANNCLVIASDIHAHREVCQDAAVYFPAHDQSELTNRMIEVFTQTNNSIFENLRQKGLKRVKNFSWKRMTQETLKIYESCISVRQS